MKNKAPPDATAAAPLTSEDGLADDITYGAAAIAEFLFGSPEERKRVYYFAGRTNPNERLPVFRMGATLCARRSTLRKWIADQEARAAR